MLFVPFGSRNRRLGPRRSWDRGDVPDGQAFACNAIGAPSKGCSPTVGGLGPRRIGAANIGGCPTACVLGGVVGLLGGSESCRN